MKRIAGYLLLAAGVLAGCARWLDLINFTDLNTEFVTVGSVWVRYGVLAALVAAAALASLMAGRSARLAPCSRKRAILAFVVCAAFAALGGPQFAGGRGRGALDLVCAVLALATAWWAALLGLAWHAKAPERPAGGIPAAMLGTILFYVMTLQRFVRNYSSFYRVGPTVSVFSALAALLFGAALIRAVYVPEGGGRKLVFTGLTAFYLCTCIELPQALCSWLAGSTTVAALAQSAALAVFGLLGAACAMDALRDVPQLPAEAENTGKTVPADGAKCTMN